MYCARIAVRRPGADQMKSRWSHSNVSMTAGMLTPVSVGAYFDSFWKRSLESFQDAVARPEGHR